MEVLPMSEKIFISPSKYVQGRDTVEKSGEYIAELGKKAMIIADKNVWEIAANRVAESLKEHDISVLDITFEGEASVKEIERISNKANEEGIDVIVGVGGGKTIDTAKGVRDSVKGAACAVIPTTASTDAPTSALSVIYSDEGVFERYRFYSKNPDLVLLDTAIIAGAPPQFLAAGIADALATWVEARASLEARGTTMAGGQATIAGQAIAEKCEQVLFDYALLAYESNKRKAVSYALEQIVEANTLLSGLGFESAGLALAHAVHNGFTVLDGDIHNKSHGEKVAFGVLTQLAYEARDQKEIHRYVSLLHSLGLPITFKDLHIEDIGREELVKVAETALQEGESSHNMPTPPTVDSVVDAMIAADQYSLAYIESKN